MKKKIFVILSSISLLSVETTSASTADDLPSSTPHAQVSGIAAVPTESLDYDFTSPEYRAGREAKLEQVKLALKGLSVRFHHIVHDRYRHYDAGQVDATVLSIAEVADFTAKLTHYYNDYHDPARKRSVLGLPQSAAWAVIMRIPESRITEYTRAFSISNVGYELKDFLTTLDLTEKLAAFRSLCQQKGEHIQPLGRFYRIFWLYLRNPVITDSILGLNLIHPNAPEEVKALDKLEHPEGALQMRQLCDQRGMKIESKCQFYNCLRLYSHKPGIFRALLNLGTLSTLSIAKVRELITLEDDQSVQEMLRSCNEREEQITTIEHFQALMHIYVSKPDIFATIVGLNLQISADSAMALSTVTKSQLVEVLRLISSRRLANLSADNLVQLSRIADLSDRIASLDDLLTRHSINVSSANNFCALIEVMHLPIEERLIPLSNLAQIASEVAPILPRFTLSDLSGLQVNKLVQIDDIVDEAVAVIRSCGQYTGPLSIDEFCTLVGVGHVAIDSFMTILAQHKIAITGINCQQLLQLIAIGKQIELTLQLIDEKSAVTLADLSALKEEFDLIEDQSSILPALIEISDPKSMYYIRNTYDKVESVDLVLMMVGEVIS